MVDRCPACGIPIRVEQIGQRHYPTPVDADERMIALEIRLRRLEAARDEIIERIKLIPVSNPIRLGLCQALEIIMSYQTEEYEDVE